MSGPTVVTKRVARNTYILSNTQTKRERGMFHAPNLKPYLTERLAGVGQPEREKKTMVPAGVRIAREREKKTTATTH